VIILDYRKHKPILIQQHVDDSSFFDRSWNEFRVGFGNRNGNFWMGNEWIHKLTKDGECKLRIDVQQANTLAWFWAEYRTFIVDSENNIYQLTVTGFSGKDTCVCLSLCLVVCHSITFEINLQNSFLVCGYISSQKTFKSYIKIMWLRWRSQLTAVNIQNAARMVRF